MVHRRMLHRWTDRLGYWLHGDDMRYHDLTITHQYQSIAEMINAGYKTRDIADQLGISRQCVRNGRRLAAAHGLISQRVDVLEPPVPKMKQPWPEGIRFEDAPQACIRQPMMFLRLS